MLRTRSILLEVCLILAASHVRCQNYDYAEGGDDHSEYAEDGEHHGHPDYSKYYSVEGSAPVASQGVANAETTGFVNPAEFTSFFAAPIVFGESSKKEVTKPQTFFAPEAEKADPLAPIKSQFPQYYSAPSIADPISRDYFEESQKVRALEKQEGSVDKPDTDFLTHSLPVASYYGDGDKAASKDDVETITPKSNKKSKYDDDYKAGASDEEEIYKFRTLGEESLPLKNDKQFVDYNVGKSSSSVSQFPYAPVLSSTTLSPYQKYSFRPVSTNISPKYLEELVSTAAPFNPSLQKVSTEANEESQSSENVPAHLKGKGCTKLQKPATNEHDAMNCFVCEDLTNKSKYTQCSYTAEPSTPVHYYTGSSERYSVPAKAPDGFRYKRHARKERDPYEIIKQKSRQYYEDFERDHSAEESERQKDFKYVPYSYDDEETSYSEAQSEEFKNNPGLCSKVEKDGMTCTVCKNEKTGGNFEQCSYTVAPNEQKFAYVAEKKYDSDDPQGETGETKENPQAVDSAEKTETGAESKEISSTEASNENEKEVSAESRDEDIYHYDANKPHRDEPTSKLVDDVHYDVPRHFAESIKDEKKADGESDEKDDYHSYHYKIFPEYAKEESKQEEEKYPATDAEKHDVEEVLAEFAKKDRSNCKKAEKNGMVCYLCIDKNKVKHEECMYVADTKPKASHIAYHEVQKYKEPKPEIPESAEATQALAALASTQLPLQISTVLPAESKRKHFFKKVDPLAVEPVAAASEEIGVYAVKKVSPKSKRRINKKKDSHDAASEKEEKNASDEAEPTQETPEEFKVGQYEGAFSAETKPVYSKIYGSHLPKYMVDKTEFEKEFDAFAHAF